MAEECDLDSLTALLDDSDMEDDTPITDKNDPQENNADEDGCDIDEITAFLEVSESDEENLEEENKKTNDKEDGPCTDDEDCDKDDASLNEVNDIQAELLEMQRKMQELQHRLAKSKASPKSSKKRKEEKSCASKDELFNTSENIFDKESPVVSLTKERSDKSNSEIKIKGNNQQESIKHKYQIKKNNLSAESRTDFNTGQNQKEKLKSLSAKNDKSVSVKSESCSTINSVASPSGQSDETSSQVKVKSQPQNGSSISKNGSLLLQEDEENPFFPAKEVKLEKCNEGSVDRKAMEKDLFGDDDSDWEPMEEDDQTKLSDEGQELRRMIKDHGKTRQSLVKSEEVVEMRKKAQKNNWKPKSLSSDLTLSTLKSSKENEVPCMVDPFSGIRIINPKISSVEMKSRMRDRKLVKVSRIDRRVTEHDNWVTVGVIVSKTEPRQSSTGKTYCIWKLSDLQDCDKMITFFLFGEVYKQHWKNEVTSVVGILNPNLMDKAEKTQSDMAFTVNHPGQVMIMGYSKDYGHCAAMTGKGNNLGKHCTNFINKQLGEYCTYHVQRAYSKKCTQRTELQGSYSGMTPSNHKYRPKEKKDGFFFYQGQTYTTGKMPGNKDSKKKITVDKLKQQQATIGKGKVTTMSLHAIDPEDIERLKKLDDPKAETTPLLDMLTVPTPGSMNFVKHLMSKDIKSEVNPETGKHIVQSVTAADLLKQHKQVMRQRKQAKISGGMTLSSTDPLKNVPTLGRGLAAGGDICLDISGSPKLDLARKKAIAKVHAKGGIAKEDPNAVRKKFSPEAHQKIRKRIHESNEPEENDRQLEPPKKRSKLLGNLDENSEEFKNLMKVRSKHTGALAEVEAEMEERYFMEQEKKERMEDKMAATMEVKVVVFTCKECNYTAHKPKDECKQQNHNLVKINTKKRFFKCKRCGNRTTSIDKLPTESCRNCGENNFERVSMLQERKGTKLPHEKLCIRGDEIKFIGSMNEKVYL